MASNAGARQCGVRTSPRHTWPAPDAAAGANHAEPHQRRAASSNAAFAARGANVRTGPETCLTLQSEKFTSDDTGPALENIREYSRIASG